MEFLERLGSPKFRILPDESEIFESPDPIEPPHHSEQWPSEQITPALPEQVAHKPTAVDAAYYPDFNKSKRDKTYQNSHKAAYEKNQIDHDHSALYHTNEWIKDEDLQLRSKLYAEVPREARDELWWTLHNFVRQHESSREPLRASQVELLIRKIGSVLDSDYRPEWPFDGRTTRATPERRPPPRPFERVGSRRNPQRSLFDDGNRVNSFARGGFQGSFTRARQPLPGTLPHKSDGLFGGQSTGLPGRPPNGLFGCNSNRPFGGQSNNIFGGQSNKLFGGRSNSIFGGQPNGMYDRPANGLFGGQSNKLFGGQSGRSRHAPNRFFGARSRFPKSSRRFGATSRPHRTLDRPLPQTRPFPRQPAGSPYRPKSRFPQDPGPVAFDAPKSNQYKAGYGASDGPDEHAEEGYWARFPDELTEYDDTDYDQPDVDDNGSMYPEPTTPGPDARPPRPAYDVPTVTPRWATSARPGRRSPPLGPPLQPQLALRGGLRGSLQPRAATSTAGATNVGSRRGPVGSDPESETRVRFEKRPRIWYYQDRHRASSAGPSGYDGYEPPAWLRDVSGRDGPLDWD